MSKQLIEMFATEHKWTRLESMEDMVDFTSRAGDHVIFVPGDPARNLESADVAVILPEIVMHFQRRFDVAIAADDIERGLRDHFGVFKTPSLIFVREGEFLGAIPKVRDWDDYVTRTTQILNKVPAAVN